MRDERREDRSRRLGLCLSTDSSNYRTGKRTGSPVGKTVGDAVAGKLVRTSGGENEIALDACVDDLDDNLLVREADNQAVLGSIANEQK